MIYVYFFIKCVIIWSENSVRCKKSYGNWLPDGPNSVRSYLSLIYGMYANRDVYRIILQVSRYISYPEASASLQP